MSRANEYAYGRAAISTASVTTTSAVALAVNTSRKSAVISNDGAADCYLACGVAAQSGKGILVKAAGRYEINCQNLFTGNIYAVTASGTTTLAIQEGQ